MYHICVANTLAKGLPHCFLHSPSLTIPEACLNVENVAAMLFTQDTAFIAHLLQSSYFSNVAGSTFTVVNIMKDKSCWGVFLLPWNCFAIFFGNKYHLLTESKVITRKSQTELLWCIDRTIERSIHHLPPFIYLFIYLFTDLFIERACPQQANVNPGGPCLSKQFTKKYTDKN